MTAPAVWTDAPKAAAILATYATKAPFQPYIRDGEVRHGRRYIDLDAERVSWGYDASGGTGLPADIRRALEGQPTVEEAIAAACAKSSEAIDADRPVYAVAA